MCVISVYINMEDRLAELHAAGGVKPDQGKKKGKKGKKADEKAETAAEKGETSNGDGDIEMANMDDGDEPIEEFMPEFYQEVGIIKTTMSSVRRSVKSIEDKYVLSLNSINVDQGSKYEEDLQSMIETTNRSFSELKKKLDLMKTNNDKYTSQKSAQPTEVRIRNNMHGTLTQKFVEMMREYQEIQTNYKNKYKEKIERQYKIVKPDATPEEIRAAMESGDSSKIFADTILYTHLQTQAKNALAYIQDRHNDIQRLEQSISELHALFLDMAVLVDVQGEMLNSIEANVESTVMNVKAGVDNLAEANKLHRRSRKKMYILLCIVVIVLIAVLAPVLATTIPKK
ncbi:t-SNARE family protein [Heterostelium album PN500]|uniref:t-SNARE family protein n=1 Tax=Heterostelium pallidum (strain ATCC 26659 / Pp 5 / PN500) TaxID=670386 RepID=D3BB02_HETP5|nr:t-SNARE family protein [Heterostelium album PN500]EFA81739.1 t-SNARE family protein [Heterostelium album PN500]|eukprot:XP_020433856.1 t-SNARE family protein [Heterostelium album PN500]